MADRRHRQQSAKDDQYAIRQYRPDDRAGVLSLYETVFGDRRGRGEWFDWKFAENPYREGVPICVAEHAGDVVGARPSLPLPLSVGGRRELALVQVDPMVHPDHRRRGLFTRMAAQVYDHYGPREPSVVIGFPNEAVKGGLEKLAETLSLNDGCLSQFSEHYRVQNPAAVASDATEIPAALVGAAATGARGYLGVRDRLAPTAERGIERHSGAPASLLAQIASRRRTPLAHALRDEEFLEWRYANPRYDYTTYVLRTGKTRDSSGASEPVAIVVGEQRGTDADVVHVSDALPLIGGRSRDGPLSALLGRVLADHREADVVAAAGTLLPRSVLAAHGFVATDRFPLSRVASNYWFSARPLTDRDVDEWVVNGVRLTESASWHLSFCELEVG